jgi:biotin-(acetyl-CoA carboxylase) ligase
METVPGSDNYKLMIGIGVNLNTSEFHYSDLKIATSILIETGMRTSVSEFSIMLA